MSSYWRVLAASWRVLAARSNPVYFFSFKPLSISLQVCPGTPVEFVFMPDHEFFSHKRQIRTKKKWKLLPNSRLPRQLHRTWSMWNEANWNHCVPFYWSSEVFRVLRSHHVLLFRSMASDCLSCLAAFGHSLSYRLLSLSLSPCRSHPTFIFRVAILPAICPTLLCHAATSVWLWEARVRLSHQGTKPIFVSCL